ncbi:MAG: alpha/beta hydrolase [Caldilineales bacterium]|nr:alpha/beta hydrolase [Caldilineales bacterium]
MPFIDTARGRFFYRLTPGDSPTLVFLHSNLGNSLWWRPVLDLLPSGWQGVAYDGIGYGYSDRTDRLDRFAISAQMLDLAAVVDSLSLAPCHIIAHSNTTPVAIEYALAYPARVASLILVGPAPSTGIVTPPEAYEFLERMPGNPDLLEHAIRSSAPSLDPQSDLFAQIWEDAVANLDGMALVATLRGLDVWQGGERLRQLTLPVLLIRGEHDVMLSNEAAHQTLLAIPGANNLEVIKGAGHSPMVERPEGFAEILVEFIAEDWQAYEAVKEQA